MFDAVEGIKFGYILCGIIWSIALGFAAGNYACSLVHRLPRGRLLLDKKPYCGTCGHELEVRDLFPVVSAVMLGHKCRYCRTPFPVSHTWTEILVGLLFVLAFLEHNFGEQYLLIVCLGVFLITLSAIEANEKTVMVKLLVPVIVFGMLLRTLVDHTIYEFFLGGIDGLFVGCILWRKQIKKVGHIFVPPMQAWLMSVGALCVGNKGLFLFFTLFAGFYAIDWTVRKVFSAKPPLITVAFGLATILPVMYPALQAHFHI